MFTSTLSARTLAKFRMLFSEISVLVSVIVTVVPDACPENHLCSGSVFLDICSNASMFRFPLNIISQTVQSFTPVFAEIKMPHGLVICPSTNLKALVD